MMRFTQLQQWILAGLLLVVARPAQAQVTNAILEASITGTLGIEQTAANSLPKLSQSKFTSPAFAKILGLPALSRDVVLALNYNVSSAHTNLFLTIYDKANKQQVTGVTVDENTVWFADAKGFVFRLDAPLPVPTNFAGGELVIVGRGKFASHGAPAAVTANVRGILVDAHGGGIPGIVLRATLKTGAPLDTAP